MLYGKKETITLDFQDADIRNLIRIFADISGFNIILSPGLAGNVNMRMNDVPWNEAMEIILANNALGRECLGSNIVRVATQATLAAEEAGRTAKKARIATDLATERNAQDLVTEVVRVNNADITDLSASLNALKSTRVDARITVDARTNTIILNDLRKHVDDMLETIRVLDVATAQVLIEAKIVEISKSFTQELGIQWGFTGSLAQTNNPNAVLLASPDSATTGRGFLVDLGQQINIGAAGLGNVSGFGLTLGSIAKGVSLATQLEALETQGKGRILSSPKITTADNKEARIKSGRQIPYQTVSTDGTTTEFIDAELSLTVLPHVTFDEKIYMTIDATKNAADFTTFTIAGIPTITTKETHTEVLVGNGDTTVLGGIYESNIVDNRKAVPFFSKIPFLGVLFKSFNESDTISELLIFVTPTIVDNGYN
jgi:type IV pilus assembly protein PilQ